MNSNSNAALNPTARREVLLRTAETLFASKGIDAVSMNEINKAAGQKNTSALHYHFGSKEKLVEAIIYQEFSDIVARLENTLDELEAKCDYCGRDLIKAIAAPFVEKLDSERGVNYLNIMVQLLDRNANMPFFEHPKQVENIMTRTFELAEPFYGHLPEVEKIIRLIMFSTLLFRSLVSFSQFEADSRSNGTNNIMGNQAQFVDVLLDSLERIIFTPGS